MVFTNIRSIWIVLLVSLRVSSVHGGQVKGSLTFVIDDTQSMQEEIDQVKARTDDVFNAVLKSNASQIDEFLIVTFNDPVFRDIPAARLRVRTTDPDDFKNTLHKITPYGGDTCPEMAMTGIELAIQASKPNSFLYVFTDASAKDYWKYETVKGMAQQKSIQVTFLLTGKCVKEDALNEKLYIVYDNLAAATSGQVFHIGKMEIEKIIEYILASIRHKRTVLLQKSYNDDECTKQFKFTVDSKMWDMLISLSSARPLPYFPVIIGPDGKQAAIRRLVKSTNTFIAKMKGKPGEYSVNIALLSPSYYDDDEGDCEEITLLVSASTSISFLHGFSSEEPTSLDETSTKPVLGKKSHLAIEVDNQARDVSLNNVELRDVHDNFIENIPLKLIDEDQQFYITDLFVPPEQAFKIAVHGHTKTKEKITRVSPTTIEYHKPPDKTTQIIPVTASVLESEEVLVEYGETLKLKCKVNGFPEPTITWEDELHELMASKINEISPNEYVAILDINKVIKDKTYYCKAENNFGEDSDHVKVLTKKKQYFNILEYPKDLITVAYGEDVEIKLKINATPPAIINWYQNDKQIVSNDLMEIITSPSGSFLKIKNADSTLDGKYYVTASNSDKDNAKYEFNITVVDMPEGIPVKVAILDAKKEIDQSLTLKCKVNAFPKPQITWEDEFNNVLTSTVDDIAPNVYITNININKINMNITYYCKAKNNFSEDSVSVKIQTFFNVLEYPKDITVEYGKDVEIKFKVDATPPATITWYEDNKEIKNSTEVELVTSSDSSILKFKNAGTRLIKGKYCVKATNGHENVTYEFKITVTGVEAPRIDKHISSYTKDRGSSVDILCRVIQGKPAPVMRWSFNRDFKGKFRDLIETKEKIHIDHVGLRHVGTYRCNAINEIGMDYHDIRLFIEYPPTVTVKPKKHASEQGQKVKLDCLVDGFPIPAVRWFRENVEIRYGGKYTIYRNNTLSFTGTINDSATYTCEASNSVDSQRKHVNVLIYDRAIIESPENSVFHKELRSNLALPCQVKGYPKPTVKWLQYPFDSRSAPKPIKCEANYTVILEGIQLKDQGFYVCTADNRVSQDKITYTVYVPAPAKIIRRVGTNYINAVEGDPMLKLYCDAIGSPKPTITWKVNKLTIGASERYEILEDGSLVINDVTSKSKGVYTCEAKNTNGGDTMEYTVYVHPYPPILEDPRTIRKIFFEEGGKQDVYCDVNYDMTRWYKDGILIKIGTLTLDYITKADAGCYTCRVSTPERSYSYHKIVVVGTKPEFINPSAETSVEYKEDAAAVFDCQARGDPPPTIKWFRNYDQIPGVNTMQYSFVMKTYNIDASYLCTVSNEFITIKRYFNITAGECLMKLDEDFTALQPMLITGIKKRAWPVFETSEGYLRIQKLRNFKFFCPESNVSDSNTIYERSVETTCVGDSMFALRGKEVHASEITCRKRIKPLAKRLFKRKCLGSNTSLLNVGFDVEYKIGPFLNVFDVCFDKKTKTPLFVSHSMHKAIANTMPKNVDGYTTGSFLSLEFEDIYDCRNQVDAISTFTGGALKDEKCCFKRRQLVNPMDVYPGISQVASYHYLNVVPQWSTCGTENWDEVELRVRQYAINLGYEIPIWTGATSANLNVEMIFLKDKLNQELHVPQFIWKVVGNQIAIIHINVPGLKPLQASVYILCEDICDSIDWMKNPHWHDIDKGFIYCCDINEFEETFNYESVFVRY